MLDTALDLEAPAQPITINPDYSIRLLVFAVIGHALLEARKGNDEARRWLYSEGLLWIDVIRGWHPDYTRRWLDGELAKRRKKTNPSQAIQRAAPPVIAERMPRKTRQPAPA